MTGPALRARHIVEVLTKHRIEYVLIGGYAATVHGAQRPTYDIDITPATTGTNLSRLADALRELRAGVADIIRSKEAAGRDKDTVALPELYRLARRAGPER